ncbi:hypothetical protein [Vibrio barjaei]|uniref:hypothetical protein n=1 Tax=Vibrio barjaei TaxID=1676683 RepID=UPI0022850ECB|nr:hypothetical protein [Vibrio barjaei]MCY9872312.1 hypothetical protein [Vibrio barjaei]
MSPVTTITNHVDSSLAVDSVSIKKSTLNMTAIEKSEYVSKAFEAMFVNTLLDTGNRVIDALKDEESPLSHSNDTVFNSFLNQQFANEIASVSNFGIAKLISKEVN